MLREQIPSPGARVRTLVAAVVTFVSALAIGAGTAGAQETDTSAPARDSGQRGIIVVQVNGLIDPANAALIRSSLREAVTDRASALVFQLDGSGGVDVDSEALADAVRESPVPVTVWVGPSGGGARGASALLALAAAYTSVAPGAHIGPLVPVDFDNPVHRGEASAVRDRRLSAKDALDAGVVDGNEPTLFQFIVGLDGRVLHTADGDVRMSTKKTVGVGANRQVQANQVVSFRKLNLQQQLAHTLTVPWVAYFLFVAGLSLILFEFFTAGIGIAGGVGALALIGGCFGFSHLPVAPWAIGLLMLGIFGLAVDLQAGGLGPWTFIGGGALVAGSIWLYDGAPALDPPWWVLVLVCGATLLFVLSGMTAMVRSRFSTPTIGREELVGEMGTAEVGVDPDGVVRVRDALWRARTNRATPIAAGDTVRVVAVEGLLLEVEPESGGARDYRDRSGRH
jgi:membrane-bound serine protease (ClpP class)